MAPTRGFRAALGTTTDLTVIAEIKRRSPSKGDAARRPRPGRAGARPTRAAARRASPCSPTRSSSAARSPICKPPGRRVGLPVLRKDFTVSGQDVCDARLMGADAVLLIAAALDADELIDAARPRRGRRTGRAGRGARRVGAGGGAARPARRWSASTSVTSSRSRSTTTGRRAWRRPSRPGWCGWPSRACATPTDAARLAAAGYDAILVGESLVTADDPAAPCAPSCTAVESQRRL